MTQEEFAALKLGDKVRIVMEKVGVEWDWEGKMDKWMGKVMTVREVLDRCVKMEEDKEEHIKGWFWYPEMIECKVEDRYFKKEEEKNKEEGEGEAIPPLVMEREDVKRIPGKDLRKRFLRELTGEKGPFEWSDFGVEFTQRWDEVSLEMVMECFDRAMEEER